jgi:cyclic pyranopterin phosphate synthase
MQVKSFSCVIFYNLPLNVLVQQKNILMLQKETHMLEDSFSREVAYLRISVTERCNFRCRYCMSEKPFSWVPKENLLNFEELFAFVKIAIDNGIKKIRITGGEPALREDLDSFIGMISAYAPHIDLSLTTNGYLLKTLAQKLKAAGLKRLNISLDSLNRETLHHIAQKDVLPEVLQGIQSAQDAGLGIKLNSVILKNINEREILPLFEYAKSIGAQIRYIEYMENTHAKSELQGVSTQEILETIGANYSFSKVLEKQNGPATLYETEDGYRFGTIEPHRHDFCATCDRLRLTAEGELIGCLYFAGARSIKEAIRQSNAQEAQAILHEVVRNKPEKNLWGSDNFEISQRAFYETGG